MKTVDRPNVPFARLLAFLLLLTTHSSSLLAQKSAQPGDFDFYLFTLSWSPQFCVTNGANPECSAGGKGFVVHGLWPEWNNGQWPSNCSKAPGPNDSSQLGDLLSESMVIHEWSKHGTCSGLTPNDYFSLIRKARDSVAIPLALANLTNRISESPEALKASFVSANPDISVADITVGCSSGYLVQIQICLNKSGQPTNCPVLKACHSAKISVRPVVQ